MKRNLASLFLLVTITSLMLSACKPVATQTPKSPPTLVPTRTPSAIEVKAVIGFTASQTGSLSVESIRQVNGLNLWMKQVNDTGGIRLADGSLVKFEIKSYDDESNKDRVTELYTRLCTEDNANFLISPYSSGLADAAADIAEQNGKLMITAGAASDATYQKGYTLVFQTYTPASKYLTGAIDLLRSTDSTVRKIAIVHENDKFSTGVAIALNEYALAQGYEVLLYEGYDTGTTDFAPFISKIQSAAPDAILGGGHFQDGSTFAKQIYDANLPVKFVALLVAPPEPTFADLGNAALGIIGPSQWEPMATFTEESATSADVTWYGPIGAYFVSAYKTAYNEEPSYHAAGGYAAGLLLQRAIEIAGSLDTQAIKAALESIDLLTFFGHLKFDTSPKAHGLQIGHSMVFIQWQKDSSGVLVKQAVWPAEGATAKPLYPLP